MEKLCESLGYSFNDRRLLVTALTHPSYGGDHHVPHYQRLEFLGDAVLELTMSEYLFEKLPEVDEGKLTRIRAAIVREETLARAAKRISLGGMIRLSVGEERTGGREKASILSDVMEAVFAAVYLDGGFECAKATILRVMKEELNPETLKDHLDAKSRLQETMQKDGAMPEYRFVSMEGPAHAPVFHYQVYLKNELLGEGSGTSKQGAQQEAARDALNRMGAVSGN